MTTLYLIRHGHYSSPSPVVPYRLPGFHLSEKGIAQTTLLAAMLEHDPIAAVFTSPMERTRETADILAKSHSLTPIVDERLTEVRSPAQGKEKEFIDAMGGWSMYDTPWYKTARGETLHEVFSRVQAAVEEACHTYEDASIIMVSHGDPVMLMAAHYMGIPPTPAALVVLPYLPMGGGYRVEFTLHAEPKIYPLNSNS